MPTFSSLISIEIKIRYLKDFQPVSYCTIRFFNIASYEKNKASLNFLEYEIKNGNFLMKFIKMSHAKPTQVSQL